MRNLILSAFITGCILAYISCNQTKTIIPEDYGLFSDTLALLDKTMQSYIDSNKVSCISLLLYKDGERILDKQYGHLNVKEKTELPDDAIFRIYSMTKLVTASSLMVLFDEGKFQLDDPVANYIPEFAATKVYSKTEDGFDLVDQENPVTIRHLLTHTSGICYGWSPNSYVDSLYHVNKIGDRDEDIGVLSRKLASVPLKFQPGTKWEYGYSIDVAGYLVEVLSGQPFDEFLKEHIFKPLGMEDTDFYVPEEKHHRLAHLYFKGKNGKIVDTGNAFGEGLDVNEIYKYPTVHFSGGGGLASTAADYANFSLMLLNRGEYKGVRILEESTVDLIMSDQLPENTPFYGDMGYGLGAAVNKITGEYFWTGAGTTNAWIDPSTNMVVLAFTQLMPADHTFANEYKDIIGRALISE